MLTALRNLIVRNGNGKAKAATTATEPYRGASRILRSMKSYLPSLLSPSQELDEGTRYDATARSRDLARNGSLGRACLDRPVEMAVQGGLRLKARPNAEILGISADESEDIGRQIEAHFNLYANSLDMDLLRTSTFADLQALAMATAFASGDCFGFTPAKEFAGCTYQTKLLLLEGEMVSNPSVSVNSRYQRDGIEIDADGTPVAYYVRQGYPTDWITGSPLDWRKEPIFSEDTGLRRCFHLYTRRRPGQYRGEVLLMPVIEKLHQAAQLDRAELAASVINAIFTVFRHLEAPVDDPNDLVAKQAQTKDNIPELPELGPGICADLFGSEKIEFADPTRPNLNYIAFAESLAKQIGATLGFPVEEILLKYDSSYSAARAAMLRAWTWYQNRRKWLGGRVLTPFYQVWLVEHAALGLIELPGFFDSPLMRAAWSRCEWLPPAKGHVDEEKEARAAQTRISSGTSCVEYEAAALGYDFWGEIYPKLKREREALLAIGIDVYDDNAVQFIQKVLQGTQQEQAQEVRR